MSTCVYSCISCGNFLCEDRYGALHIVRGNTYLHMYGLHLHRRTMMMRMLWVMMGMFVPFVATCVQTSAQCMPYRNHEHHCTPFAARSTSFDR